jgi:anti-anti-sigma factor
MAPSESSSVTVSRRRVLRLPGSDGARTVVWLRGEHDASTVAVLSEALARAIANDDADVVVDLSGVQFMDAATVGVISWAREVLGVRSRSLVLRSPSSCARRVLELCDEAALLGGADAAPAPRTVVALDIEVAGHGTS